MNDASQFAFVSQLLRERISSINQSWIDGPQQGSLRARKRTSVLDQTAPLEALYSATRAVEV